ncbi:hypothetical protein Y032_0115g515 [Ancylostoma ceylanicum]|uniref:Uncharacterized protein n=1 Tax=Ancylostoma ceylanicum TaxID=53326 RepID=A0A016TD08_9BILA|nr:hypothetical protein Y032_0115g515 [Ancylostoma ceylanicum]
MVKLLTPVLIRKFKTAVPNFGGKSFHYGENKMICGVLIPSVLMDSRRITLHTFSGGGEMNYWRCAAELNSGYVGRFRRRASWIVAGFTVTLAIHLAVDFREQRSAGNCHCSGCDWTVKCLDFSNN